MIQFITRTPFKPETWPRDVNNGTPARLCTVCGTPVQDGDKHRDCSPQVTTASAAPEYVEPAPEPLEKRVERLEAQVKSLYNILNVRP